MNVRLWGIDAPESQQEYATESQSYLVKLLTDKDLKLECFAKSYHRKVCKIFYDGKNASEEMVKAGWAWDYSQFSLKLFKKEELNARKNKLGIWKSEKTISPFCSRHSEAKACVKLKNLYQP